MHTFKQATLVASVAAALTLTAVYAQAQLAQLAQPAQSAPAPQAAPTATPVAPPAPPSWQQGRPDSLKSSTLAPNPPGLTAKAASAIKLDKIKLPPGFKIELWAEGMPNARSIAVGDKGTVFVGTRLVEEVYAVTEKDGKRTAKRILKGLHRPNGIVFHKGDLYVAELSRILKFRDIENNLDNPGKPEVVFDALPKDEPHGWKYMVMGPDNKLYFNIGAPCNICVPPDTHAQITRVDPVKGVRETVVKGNRCWSHASRPSSPR